jgi:putative transposase
MPTPRRKRKKTYDEPGHAHFLTFSCVHRWPLLNKDRSRRWFINALQNARDKLDFDIWAYVIMPEHAHVHIWPRRRKYRMRSILAAIKRPVAVEVKRFLIESNETEWLARLTVRKGDRDVFRLWQPGGGYDTNLSNDRPIENVMEYIDDNPRRRGLVQRATDWYWSSARWHAGQQDGPIEVDTPRL